MRYFFLPTQDASIYSQFPGRNTGFDEILEVGKTNVGQDAVRSLVSFDIPSASLSAQYDLVLYTANAFEMTRNQTLVISTVAGSWTEGDGYFYQNVIQAPSGIIWNYTGSVFGNPTQSVNLDAINLNRDVRVDVTSLVRGAISASLPTVQLGLSLTAADERNKNITSNIRFFSRNTHTIFAPRLIQKVNDQVYATGSLSASMAPRTIKPINLKMRYAVNEMATVDLHVRPRNPLKTFASLFTAWTVPMTLPTTSYFSIVDEQTGTTIIPFDEFSAISIQNNRVFIKFIVQHMNPLRYYRIKFKVVENGEEEIIDNNFIFTVSL